MPVSGYVNAGGRGTRLGTVFQSDPKIGITKALLNVGEPPVALIDHQINRLSKHGISPIVVGAGDHEVVARHIERQRYSSEVIPVTLTEQMGNGGDLLTALRLKPDCFGEHVFIVSVDGIIDMDEQLVIAQHKATNAELTIVLTKKKGVPNEGAFCVQGSRVLFNREAKCNSLDEQEAIASTDYRGSSTGALIVKRELLETVRWSPDDGPLGLYRDIVALGLERGKFHAYDNEDRFFLDVGTVDSWRFVQENAAQFQPFLETEF